MGGNAQSRSYSPLNVSARWRTSKYQKCISAATAPAGVPDSCTRFSAVFYLIHPDKVPGRLKATRNKSSGCDLVEGKRANGQYP